MQHLFQFLLILFIIRIIRRHNKRASTHVQQCSIIQRHTTITAFCDFHTRRINTRTQTCTMRSCNHRRHRQSCLCLISIELMLNLLHHFTILIFISIMDMYMFLLLSLQHSVILTPHLIHHRQLMPKLRGPRITIYLRIRVFRCASLNVCSAVAMRLQLLAFDLCHRFTEIHHLHLEHRRHSTIRIHPIDGFTRLKHGRREWRER
mmetsp:Transcript_44247/g.73166  ORF Transcript_44247/g.73166 Transcript_44247/m.73166 type:complete len:205 (-) Transcript_44247:377-991(-)